jgi:hypothetical protein
MERGSVTGQMGSLTWTPGGDKPGHLTVGKRHLAKGSLARPPMLAAGRCAACGIGIFEFGQT